MSKAKELSRALITCALAVLSFNVHAVDYDDLRNSCESNVGKLWAVYRLRDLPGEYKGPLGKSSLENEMIFLVIEPAIGPRSRAERGWPGFFDWATKITAQALRNRQSAEDFRRDAEHLCLLKFMRMIDE